MTRRRRVETRGRTTTAAAGSVPGRRHAFVAGLVAGGVIDGSDNDRIARAAGRAGSRWAWPS